MASLPQGRADAHPSRGLAGADGASWWLSAVPGDRPVARPDAGSGLLGDGRSAPLGTTTKSQAANVDLRALRWRRQGWARTLLPSERVVGCLRYLHRLASEVKALHIPGREYGAFSGLQVCGSVWTCPVCSAKISERRRVEVQGAVDQAVSIGFKPAMVTLTGRHRVGESLRSVLRRMQRARVRMAGSRRYKTLMARDTLKGSIRAVEVTHGLNGWHPHYHELRFLWDCVDLAEFEAELRVCWLRALDGEGGSGNGYAVSVVWADTAAGDYLVKLDGSASWTAAHELTKQVVKKGRHGSRSPVDLLDAYGAGDSAAGLLWIEYAQEMKGCRQLVWSRGLREVLSLGAELSDQEVVEKVEETAVVLHTFTEAEWLIVRSNDLRHRVCVLSGRADGDGIRRLLAAQGDVRLNLERSRGEGPW